MKNQKLGVYTGGRNTNNLQYAVPSETKDLKHLIKMIKEASKQFGLLLNVKKAKLMTTARNGHVKTTIDGKEIECVQKFTFLGL